MMGKGPIKARKSDSAFASVFSAHHEAEGPRIPPHAEGVDKHVEDTWGGLEVRIYLMTNTQTETK